MAKVLWDRDNDERATNWDGGTPVVDGDNVYIKDLGCNCNPATGNVCGSCSEIYREYPIGENERYFWRADNKALNSDKTKQPVLPVS